VAAHFTTISAILVPAATAVIRVPTFVGAVSDVSAVLITTDPIRGVTAKAGSVAIEVS
jgi:hypothetical protein